MSLFGALRTGVSGLSAQSSAMSIISDNIANVNTIGYKANSASFSTLVTKQVTSSHYTSGGVQCRTCAGVDIQGLLGSTSYSTDLGISGSGFFVTTQVSQPEQDSLWSYTRVGSFSVDQDGYLKNDNGYYLQAWPLQAFNGEENASLVQIGDNMYMKAYTDEEGTTVYVNDNIIDRNNLRPINLSTIGGTAQETQRISLGANLPADAPIFDPQSPEDGGRYSSSLLIYDSLGNSHNATLTFTKTSSNCWSLDIGMPSGAATFVTYSSSEITNDSAPDVHSARAQLEFDSIPMNHSYISMETNGKNYVYEFTTDHTTVYSPNTHEVVIPVDLSAGIVTESDAVGKLYEAIQSTMSGAGRFGVSPDGRTIEVQQSNAGSAITFKIATTSCLQVATNPDPLTGVPSGIFELPEIDWDVKNTARLEFTSATASDYLNKSIAIGNNTYAFSNTGADIPGAIAVNISTAIDERTGTVDTIKLVSLLRSKIIENEPDYIRYVASGSTLEINPTQTGSPILVNSGDSTTITFQNTNLAAYLATATTPAATVKVGDPDNPMEYEFIDTVGVESGTTLLNGHIAVNIGNLKSMNMREELPTAIMNELYNTVQAYYQKNPNLEDLSGYLRVSGSTMVSTSSYMSTSVTTAPAQKTVKKQTLSFVSTDVNDYVSGQKVKVYGSTYTFSKFGVTTETNIDITDAIESQVLTFAAPAHQTKIVIGDMTYEFVDTDDADPTPSEPDGPQHTTLEYSSGAGENTPENAAHLVAHELGLTNVNETLTLSGLNKAPINLSSSGADLAENVTPVVIMNLFAEKIDKSDFTAGASMTLTQFGANPFDNMGGDQAGGLLNLPDELQDFIASNKNGGVKSAVAVTGKDKGRQSVLPDTDGLLLLTNTFTFNNVEGAQSGSLIPSVRFNADGTPLQINTGKLEIEWANGAKDMTGKYYESSQISLQLGDANTANGLTQLAGKFATNYINQDGAKFGNYTGVSISESGIVTAIFDNGETRAIAQIPLATFVDVNSLEMLSGNAYIETTGSGNATLRTAGESGAGLISSSALENSTVDIAEEFTNMITTQRAYSAASKIITTADSMLEELLTIKR